jgi:hypothetical protein
VVRARAAALAGAAALAAGVAWRVTGDWDAFWHLRIGSEVLARRSTLPVDLFSYFALGRPWPYKDVVADVILYAGFPALGFWWLALCKTLVVLGCGLGLWRATPAPRPAPWLAVLGLLIAAIEYRIAERPLLFSLALAPLLLAQLERARVDGARCMVTATAIVWLWAQLHREAMVGLVLLFGFAQYLVLARVLAARLPWLLGARPEARLLVAAQASWALAAVLALLNPSGAALYRSTLAVFGTSALKQSILEWQALPAATIARLLPASTALALAGAAAIAISLAAARRARAAGPLELWHLGCWLLFAERTLDSVRWLPYLCIVSALALLRAVLPIAQERVARRITPPLAIGAIALSLAVHPYPLGLGEAPDHFPSAALAFAARAGLHERVANTLPFGGYVMWRGWPRFLVQIDGRNDMIYPPAYLLRCRDAERDAGAFAALRAEDGADWVLAENHPGSESHRFLLDEPGWALAFHSDAALVWVRRDAYPALPPLRYVPDLLRDGLPATLARVRAAGEAEALIEELERVLRDDPDGISAHLWLARAYDGLGRAERRDEVMRHLLTVRPGWVTTGVR